MDMHTNHVISHRPSRREPVLRRLARHRALWMLPLIAGVLLGTALMPLRRSRDASALVPEFGLVCTDGPSYALRATSGYISMPDGNSVYMWSYANDAAGPGTGAFQYTAPTLCVNEGDTVTVTLTNDLPENVSILFPGQQDVLVGGVLAQPEFSGGVISSLTNSAPPGGSVTYNFVASHPGTYLYESGTEPDKQTQMGLVGALIVRPSMGPDFSYDDATTQFQPGREFLLLMHEIDPILHQDVELGLPYDVTKLHFRYWTMNGRALPDTIAPNNAPWLPAQPYGSLVSLQPVDSSNPYPALIRMVNAGMDNHPFHPHANSVRVIAQDGRMLLGGLGEDLSYEKFGRTIAAGQTFDSLFAWTDVSGFNPATKPVPVTIPGLLNLVFKGGETWYGGSPYLGLQGELPVGTTSYNQCGEQYFPWHSHALNEFENFNEAFGGLATFLRVDPPGGC